jgi:hypothetical protein
MIPSPISTSGRFDVSTFPDPSLPCSLPSCLRAFVPPCLPRSLPSSLLASPPRCLVASLPFFPPNKPTNPRGAIKKAVCVKKTNPTRTQTNPPVPSPKRQRGVPFQSPKRKRAVPRFQSPKRQRGDRPKPHTTDRTTPTWPRRSEPRPSGSAPPLPHLYRHGTASTSRHSPFAPAPPGPVHVLLAICHSLRPGPAGPKFGRISLDGGRGQAP